MTNFKIPHSTAILCDPSITQVKDGPYFIKFLKSSYSSYTIHIYEKANIFGGLFFLQILVEVLVGILNFLFFLYLSCLLHHLSMTGFFCCYSLFCGNKTSAECYQVIRFFCKSFDWYNIIDSVYINQYNMELKYMQVVQILIFQIKVEDVLQRL